MTELRGYQQELLEQAADSLIPSRARVMLQLPTGGGKTHIAGALLRRWLHSGRKAVWLTHRAELADQTCGMLTDAGASAISLKTWPIGNDAPSIPNGAVVLMAQTVGRRTSVMEIWGRYSSNDLLVIDEAHHATAAGWERAIEQWPGRIIGLTATPWRLSKFEGFDHLFHKLIYGPQVGELQAKGWLCQASVHMPRPEEIIRGGEITTTGDYGELGIEEANSDRPDVMTAGALRFWQFHAAERSTIVYAIGQDHARNLTAVFNDAGITAAVILGDTAADERAKAVQSFGDGSVRVLVNVAVANEGFDLPDASCIVITRPTMSLALYLQMVGRGLRPKADGGDCLILDLAGNAEIHGLPQDNRQWSLQSRGDNPGGYAPVVRCENCDGVSPAASHLCVVCQNPFGKDCLRCGAWRAMERWSYETRCGERHELVCDLCHLDAHIQAQLPVSEELRRLTDMNPELEAALRNLLEEERRRAGGADEERKDELRSLISDRESELASDGLLQVFEGYIAELPEESRPKNALEEYWLFSEWVISLKQELADWKGELDELGSKIPDGRLIYKNARDRVWQVLEVVAQETGLLAQVSHRDTLVPSPVTENPHPVQADVSEWKTFVQLGEWGKIDPSKAISDKPIRFRDSLGNETSVRSWADLIWQTADWLVQGGFIAKEDCPVTMENSNRYLINSRPVNAKGANFKFYKKLSNNLYLNCQHNSKLTARLCEQLLTKFGHDPAKFHVMLH